MISISAPGQNPFSTCWIRPTSCRYRCRSGESLEKWTRRLEMAGGGQLVGPHGAGKSTLLASLVDYLRDRGEQVRLVQLVSGVHRLPNDVRRDRIPHGSWLAIDGCEQLSAWSRWRLRRAWRAGKYRLLITHHHGCAGMYSIQVAPDLAMAQDVVRNLQGRGPAYVFPEDVERLFAIHGMNLRELLFDCYDIHQRRQRATNS